MLSAQKAGSYARAVSANVFACGDLAGNPQGIHKPSDYSLDTHNEFLLV
jgi:hypothetical protein